MKGLRQAYQKAREGNPHSGPALRTYHFYKELDATLGGDPTSTAKSPVDTSVGLQAVDRGLKPEPSRGQRGEVGERCGVRWHGESGVLLSGGV